eukprot:gene13667-16095_t
MVIKGGYNSDTYTVVHTKASDLKPKQPEKKKVSISLVANNLVAEDVTIRVAAVKQLKRLFNDSGARLNDLDHLKLWRALYLNVWASDKPKAQDELNTKIGDLILSFRKPSDSLKFVRAFFVTILQKWDSIDHHRLDKYYALVRKMFHFSFKLLQKCAGTEGEEGEDTVIASFVEVLKTTCLSPAQKPTMNGIILHIADLYLVELYRVTDGELQTLSRLLLPFINFVAKSEDDVAIRRIRERVFTRLLTTFSPFGKRDEWMIDDESAIDDEGYPIPQIFPTDYKVLSKLLFKCGSSKSALDQNRKALYSISGEFDQAQKLLESLEEDVDNIIEDNDVEGDEEEEEEEGEEVEDDQEMEEDDEDMEDEDEEEEEEEVVPVQQSKKGAWETRNIKVLVLTDIYFKFEIAMGEDHVQSLEAN